jgi:hypothetical protein
VTRFERALTDLVGGYDGGAVLWLVSAMRLEVAVQRARDVDRFRAYPEGVLNRLLVDVDDALGTGEVAVDLQRLLIDGGDEQTDERRRQDVGELLLARARELADARLHATPDEWEAFSPRRRGRR